jgi:hypothetical protein
MRLLTSMLLFAFLSAPVTADDESPKKKRKAGPPKRRSAMKATSGRSHCVDLARVLAIPIEDLGLEEETLERLGEMDGMKTVANLLTLSAVELEKLPDFPIGMIMDIQRGLRRESGGFLSMSESQQTLGLRLLEDDQ